MDAFERIAAKASSDAANAIASPEQYREGLRLIIERLEEDIEASKATNP